MSATKTVSVSWIAGFLLLACTLVRASDAPATQPSTQPSEKTHVMKRGTLSLEIHTDGTLQPADPFEVKLRLKAYSGPLTVVSAAAHGATVRKGDLLLDCDTTQLNWNLQQAENELASAQANLRRAEADQELGSKADALALRMQQQALSNAEAGVKWFESLEGPQMLLSADLTVRQYEDSVGDQEDELDQLRKMYKTEDLTNATKDIVIKRAVRRLEMSKTYLQMQQGRREKVKSHDYAVARQRVLDSLEQARQALASLEVAQAQSAVLRRNSLSNARVAFEQAQKKLNELKEDAAAFSIKAPADGVLVYAQVPDAAEGSEARTLRAGDKLAAGQVVMRLMSPGKMRAEISPSEAQAFWIEAGMKAKVSPAALPMTTYEGACLAPVAGAKANSGFSVQTSILLEQVDPRLLPGMKAKVDIEAARLENVLLLPMGAVAEGAVSVRRKDGTVEKRPVVLGRTDGQQVEVRSGLTEGEEVILAAKK